MLVPASTYAGFKNAHRLGHMGTDPFWPGEEPVPMMGSRTVRKFFRDRAYRLADGYMFEMRDRYLRRYKPTVIGAKALDAFWQRLTERIRRDYGQEGRTFGGGVRTGWSRQLLIDGELREFKSNAALLLSEIADVMLEPE
jgi:hypothetical protein